MSAGLQEALEGRYVLERELGRGGMGIVYLARELALNRPVALKLLPPAAAEKPHWRERFLREAETAAKLSHPNIVPIFAVHEVNEFVFFTMAYVEGQTLAQRIRSRGPLPVAEATRVLHQVAQAVHYAHEHGVIHRDLKAGNILLERGSGRALVTDFGIARVRDQPAISADQENFGTWLYWSPEQAAGHPADERSDIYALGVLGYYAATGRFPFVGATASDVLDQHIRCPAPVLASAIAQGDDTLPAVVERCLAKDPAARFQRAAALAGALAASPTLSGALPAPLRAFLDRVRHLSKSNAGIGLVGVLAVVALIDAVSRGAWDRAAIAAGVLVSAITIPVARVLPVVRQVLGAGFSREDMVAVLRTDVAAQEKALAFRFGAHGSLTERIAAGVAWGGLVPFGLGAVLGIGKVLGEDPAVLTMFAGAGTTVIFGLLAGHLYRRRHDLLGQVSLWFCRSRFGEWAARLAGMGLKRLPARATRARKQADVERVFARLPEPQRRLLADLPDAFRRIEFHTGELRTLIGELEHDIATQRGGPSQQLIEARDAARERLMESTSSLENILLQLIRLRDGVATAAGVTAEVAAAREIGDAVDRVLQARREVREALGGAAATKGQWS